MSQVKKESASTEAPFVFEIEGQLKEVKKTLVYFSSFSGTSKKGNEFNSFMLVQLIPQKDEKTKEVKISAFKLDYFTPAPLDVSHLNFGDVVECTLIENQILSRPLQLLSIDKVLVQSPYFKFVK